VVATAIVDDPENPEFEPLWKAPPFDDPEALRRFRDAPSHPVVSKSDDDGERYVWVVDAASPAASLLGIRARDGRIVVEQELAGRVDTIRPLHHEGVLYVPSRAPGDSGAVLLEAFTIKY